MEDNGGWQIVRRCVAEANGPAWTAFVERFEPALDRGIRRGLYRLGFEGDRRDLAADLLQECYCKILARERRILEMCRERDEAALDAFFGRLAERCARDCLRARWSQKRGRRGTTVAFALECETLALATTEPSPEERALIQEARSRLLEACRLAAGARQRERNTKVLMMAFLEGLSSREIASRFAGRLSLACIDSVVYRARRRLRQLGGRLVERRAIA
jgi:DNA-directed RNA polymerase specialized sigma24 family protein